MTDIPPIYLVEDRSNNQRPTGATSGDQGSIGMIRHSVSLNNSGGQESFVHSEDESVVISLVEAEFGSSPHEARTTNRTAQVCLPETERAQRSAAMVLRSGNMLSRTM